MKEIWRTVVGYEGYYEVSNWGRVRSLPRKTRQGMRGGRILRPTKNKGGYLRVTLSKNGKMKSCRVHRLVGMAFPDLVGWTEKAKGRPFKELEINHKDQNKQNNRVENLEWCDGLYNHDYGTHNEQVAKANTNGKRSKIVYQYTLDGEFVREWSSVNEVERQTGWRRCNISQCCNSKRNHVAGFKWSYIKLQ